jgi:hypothetical protein
MLIGCEAVVDVYTLTKLAYTKLTSSFYKKKFKYELAYRGPTQVAGDNSCGEVSTPCINLLVVRQSVRLN